MSWIPITESDRTEMLAAIGVENVEDLFKTIPDELRRCSWNIPQGRSEMAVRGLTGKRAEKNARRTTFLGGGYYDHFIPAAVDALAGRSEFYTAYTPYQPELSQGTLQAMYEFQSAICRLTGMEVANASLYDGGTAIYEAIMMSLRVTRRSQVIVDETVNPIYRKMIRSYTRNLGIELLETPPNAGKASRDAIAEALSAETAAVVVQNPNFFGVIEDYTDLSALAQKNGALLIVSCYPISLGLLKTPGQMGADIVVGEGQSLGMGISFGGPYLGFMTTREKHMRKMPGRVAGRTVDSQGREGFVMTLQAREQHIRREKATSNLCTNQNLCALRALVYMSLLGKQGLRDIAQACADRAYYAQERLLQVPGVRLQYPGHWYFNEFVLELPARADQVIRRLLQRGVAAGFPLLAYYPDMEKSLLVAVTEERTKAQIDFFAHVLEVSL